MPDFSYSDAGNHASGPHACVKNIFGLSYHPSPSISLFFVMSTVQSPWTWRQEDSHLRNYIGGGGRYAVGFYALEIKGEIVQGSREGVTRIE